MSNSSRPRIISINNLPPGKYIIKMLEIDGSVIEPTSTQNYETDTFVIITPNTSMIVNAIDNDAFEILETKKNYGNEIFWW